MLNVGDVVELLSLNQARNCALMRGVTVSDAGMFEKALGPDNPNSCIVIVRDMIGLFGKKGTITRIDTRRQGRLFTTTSTSTYCWNDWQFKEFYVC